MSRIISVFILTGAAIICYLSWLPSPRLSIYGFFTEELGRWVDADANMNIRTAVPFLCLGLMSGLWLVFTRQPGQRWVGLCLGFMGIALVAEAGQLEIPDRHFDWGDIAWGTAGALAGMASGAVFAYLVALLRPSTPTA